jgi:hypothetical protein
MLTEAHMGGMDEMGVFYDDCAPCTHARAPRPHARTHAPAAGSHARTSSMQARDQTERAA